MNIFQTFLDKNKIRLNSNDRSSSLKDSSINVLSKNI